MARVLVAGAGALGSVFGGLLARRGHSVTLFGRPSHMEAIRDHGLSITGIWGDHFCTSLTAVDRSEQLEGEFDAIFVTVKSYDTETMARAVAAHLGREGVYLSLQNGLGNAEAIVRATGCHRVLAARVIFGATIDAPGRARVTVYADPVLVGVALNRQSPPLAAAAEAWAESFTEAGIPSEACADVTAALWAKVFYNAALNPLGALLGLHYGALPENPDTRAVMDEVIDEAFSVACAEGVELPWQSAAAYREIFYGRLVPSTYDHRSSMLQDLERGRRTEIDAINGEVWRRATEHGLATPRNEVLTRLVRARQAQAEKNEGTSG